MISPWGRPIIALFSGPSAGSTRRDQFEEGYRAEKHDPNGAVFYWSEIPTND